MALTKVSFVWARQDGRATTVADGRRLPWPLARVRRFRSVPPGVRRSAA